jgi:hypothetical protein
MVCKKFKSDSKAVSFFRRKSMNGKKYARLVSRPNGISTVYWRKRR